MTLLPANPYACAAATVARPNDARLMSRYGMRPSRRDGNQRLHAGVDIGGRRGQPIYAARGGVVELVGADAVRRGPLDGYGNAVVIRHDDEGKWALYAHLDRALVTAGQRVEAGEQIGEMGATTNGKFPGMVHHLHLEVRTRPLPGPYGRDNIDPAVWLAEHGLGFSRDGLTWDAAAGACPSGGGDPGQLVAALTAPALHGLGSQMAEGAPAPGGRVWVRVGGTNDNPSMMAMSHAGLGDVPGTPSYEPPVPDPDWFRPASALVRWGIPLALGGVGLVGLALTLDAIER